MKTIRNADPMDIIRFAIVGLGSLAIVIAIAIFEIA